MSGIGPLIAPQYQISTISTAVATSITLGGGAYASTLTVTGSGSVAPTAYGATAVYVNGAGYSLLNQGAITGGGGSFGQYQGGDGGAGVSVSGGTVTNSGTITGGGGGYGSQAYAGSGGAGVSVSGSTLTNDGTIAGGSGGVGPQGGNGGAGVSLSGGTVSNDGIIAGGSGGYGFDGGNGGAGVSVSGGTVSNDGTIAGGSGGTGRYPHGGNGGVGVSVSGGTVTNDGSIAGGSGGTGLYLDGGNGGAGVYLNGGTVFNAGTITGGIGGAGYHSGSGGAAVQFGSAAGTLVIEQGAVFDGAIAGVRLGDVLVQDGFVATSATYVSGKGLELIGANSTLTLDVTGNFSRDMFAVSNDGTNTTVQVDMLQISIISTAFTTSVTLGSGVYSGAITVTGSGSVAPTAYGATAVYVNGAGYSLLNQGRITGGGAYYYYSGGVGVSVSGGTVTNDGTIAGGGGDNYFGGSGGAGLSLSGGTVTNAGIIAGGSGGYGSYRYDAGNGGAGLVMSGGTVTNSGTILGSSAGAGFTGGGGGAGVSLSGGTVTNDGTIAGGSGGYGRDGGSGGAGVSVSGGTVTNDGSIAGGSGGNNSLAYAGHGSGGAGVSVSGGTVSNDGTITGGAGAYGYRTYAGNGGAGVSVSGGTVTNDGTIAGGSGGNGFYGGNGGAGVSVSGGTLTNDGTIAGGAGGSGTYGGNGSGAAGVYLNGGTVINAGTIAGYGSADAVQFGSVAATLVIDPGAVFVGNVAANSSVHDVLELSGTAFGTLGGLGTQFTGFTTIKEDLGSNWMLAGANTLGANTLVKMYGRLGVPGQLTDAGTILVGHGGLLRAGGYGAILTAGISLYSGSLAEGATGTLVVGNTLAGAAAGALTVEAGYAISGHGTIGGVPGTAVVDDGTITAAASGDETGTLNIVTPITGTGTLALDSGQKLIAHGAVSVANILFNAGTSETLYFLAPKDVTSDISGFAVGDTIDLYDQKVRSLSYANGTLTLVGAHNTVLETLSLTGDYTTADFTMATDHHGGTDIGFAANADTVPQTTLPPDHAWQANPMDLLATAHHFGMWGG